MAKRRKKVSKTRSTARQDPCGPERERLKAIDDQIADIIDQINDPGIPPAVKARLRAKLPALQRQRQQALGSLDKCEMQQARRSA